MDILNEIVKIFNDKSSNDDFGCFGKLYHHTNENLKAYIPDLRSKSVLTVSSSGDHLLNILSRGCLNIDTFDINKFSPLYQNLKLCSIKFLPSFESYEFLNSLMPDLYYKFNCFLPKCEKSFFNYVFNYDIDEIAFKLFYLQKIDNIINNNYFDMSVLKYLKHNIRKLNNTHYCCDIYRLPLFLTHKYDYMFFSNISQYVKNVDDFIYLICYLKFFLNDGGCIYYAYLYEKEVLNSLDGIKSINDNFFNKFDFYKHKDFVSSTDFLSFSSAEYPNTKKDSVLFLKK